MAERVPHWRSSGPDDADAVVLLHGLGGSGRAFDRLAPLLEDRFRVLVPDLPGFGRSASLGDDVSIGAQARAVERVLDDAGVDRAVVVGHSMGGLVATALAERSPQRVARLVLVNATPSVESRRSARSASERALSLPLLGPLLWRVTPEAKLRDGLRSAFAPGADVDDVFVADLRATPWTAFTGATAAIDAYLAERPLADRLRALSLPVDVVYGEQDGRVDPEAFAALGGVPGVSAHPIAAAGHTPIWETPEAVARLIAGAG